MEDKESIYNYRQHGKSFSRENIFHRHIEFPNGITTSQTPPVTRISILGGGFAGIQVLKKIQAEFQNDTSIEITLVSKDNFFLFTPMLPEVVAGTIEPIHIATPIRALCNSRTKFYKASTVSIELQNKQVVIIHSVNDNNKTVQTSWHQQDSNACYHILKYDYLILALGNETNFFGNANIANNALTIKSLHDAIILRDHIINMLEQADLEYENEEQLKRLMTFVVVGGGFVGIETIAEINSFIHNSINNFYHNIKNTQIRVVLVNAHKSILPEVTEDLSEFALQKLRDEGIEVMLNTRVVDADLNSVKLDNGSVVLSNTLIWAGGVKPNKFIADLSLCEHDKTGRIIVNSYLEAIGHTRVFALGDCASILDANTGKTCPPTAQHAIRQGTVVARNIISEIKRTRRCKNGREEDNNRSKIKFDYKTKGVMAKIGKRNGVGILLGHKVHGFAAWLLGRTYYLANLPTFEKKWRVTIDWTMDILFKKDDMTRLKTFLEVNTTRHIVDEIQLPQNQRRI